MQLAVMARKYGPGDTGEVDAFLRKQTDDYPFSFVQKVTNIIATALRLRNVITDVPGHAGKVQDAANYTKSVVENI